MPPDPDKRRLRELKRLVKKRGNKTRRAELKRNLVDHPEEAAHAEETVGRHVSKAYNGQDRSDAPKP